MEEKHCKWYNDEFCTNDKSPCVADYCPVVEYPDLCKHREVVKGINVRSKDDTDTNVGMTDEEVVKALECCANDEMCRECPYFINGIDCGNQRSENDYLDLIKRQKAEIEWLKDENIEQRDIHFKNLCEYKDEIARLEKQVDELKTENKELYKEHTTLIAGSILEKQDIVRETAEKFARLVEFHSVSTRDNDGREIFTISALGLKEILHEEFGIPYKEICKEITEGN